MAVSLLIFSLGKNFDIYFNAVILGHSTVHIVTIVVGLQYQLSYSYLSLLDQHIES